MTDRQPIPTRSRPTQSSLASLLLSTRPATAAGSDIIPYAGPCSRTSALGGLEGYLPVEWGPAEPRLVPAGLRRQGSYLSLHCAGGTGRRGATFGHGPKLQALILAVLVGLVVWGLWIGLDGHYPALPFLGKRGGFDFETLAPRRRSAFIGVRMLGLVVLVPLVEELFWRSFLIRWLIDQDFQKSPDRARHGAGGGGHVGDVRPGASRMAAGLA